MSDQATCTADRIRQRPVGVALGPRSAGGVADADPWRRIEHD